MVMALLLQRDIAKMALQLCPSFLLIVLIYPCSPEQIQRGVLGLRGSGISSVCFNYTSKARHLLDWLRDYGTVNHDNTNISVRLRSPIWQRRDSAPPFSSFFIAYH